MRLDYHPLLMQTHRLMREFDCLPAHETQTALITELGQWMQKVYKHLEDQGLLNTTPTKAVAEGEAK